MATQVNDSNFDAVVLQSQLPVLVDFWAPWCGPCRAIGPIIDELANEYEGKLSVVKLNVDESPSTPGKYGIRAIPTLILFKNGEVVEQVTGAVSKSSIATMIEQRLWHEALRRHCRRRRPRRDHCRPLSLPFRDFRGPDRNACSGGTDPQDGKHRELPGIPQRDQGVGDG